MKRPILVIVTLFGTAFSTARADYLRLFYKFGDAEPTSSAKRPSRPGAASTPQPPPLPGKPSSPSLPSILERLLPESIEADEPDEANLEAAIVIEYHKADVARFVGETGLVPYARIHHKWGATCLAPNLTDIAVEFLTEEGIKLPTVSQRYRTQHDAKLKNGPNIDGILELAEWTLNHADIANPVLLNKFVELMEELREVSPNHSTVKAFDKIQSDLASAVSTDDVAINWKDRLNYRVKRSPHYAVLHAESDYPPAAVDIFLNLLEENLRGFYYWFALKGRALPVATRRLVGVLVDDPGEFQAYRQAFDDADLYYDGFYSRSDNLAVFCASRQDESYHTLAKFTSPLWLSGWDMDDLLKGRGHPGASTDEVVKNQMLALLQRAMADESARASVSHVATRQLLVSTGLVNAHVEVPEWIRFGIGSFFETPTGSYWPGVGAPNWKYMVNSKLWERVKKLDRPEDAIQQVVTDDYFRLAREKGGSARMTTARTMSWSLAYFLLSRKLDGVFRYLEEFNKLPRDMLFDDETHMLCFGRAFNLIEPSDPDRLNPKKLYRLADEWYSFIDLTPMESSEALQDAFRRYKQKVERTRRP